MARIIKNNFGNSFVIFVIFVLMASWFYSGWPRIWQNPPIPPEIQKAQAAIAYDAVTESHTGTTGSASQASFTFSHNPVGTPRGILVFVFTISATKTVTGVTYDGEALTEVSGGAAVDTLTEVGRVDTFFLGSGVNATDPANVVVSRTNNAVVMYAVSISVTAAADTRVTGIVLLQENQVPAEQSVDDGSPGTDSVRFAGSYYGGNSPAGAGANSTLLVGIDLGSFGNNVVRETTAGQGSRPVGFSAGSDDFAAVHLAVAEITAALTGTVTASITESDIVAGGKTIILTLNGDTWVAAGATFDAQRQNIINGIDSAQAEGTGWDLVVKAGQAVGGVVRTSDTVVTITLDAFAGYDITAQETITATIPATALVGGNAITATPTFTIDTAVVYCIIRTDSEGTIEYGNVDLSGSTSTEPTTGSNQTAIVQNCGGTQAKFNIKTGNSTNWTAISGDPSGQTNQFRHSFGTSTDPWKVMGIDPSYVIASSTVSSGTSMNIYLKIELPQTDTSNYSQQSVTATVQAAAP